MLTRLDPRPSAAQVGLWLLILGVVGLTFGLASSALSLDWWALPLAPICSGALLLVLAFLGAGRRRSTRRDDWLGRL